LPECISGSQGPTAVASSNGRVCIEVEGYSASVAPEASVVHLLARHGWNCRKAVCPDAAMDFAEATATDAAAVQGV